MHWKVPLDILRAKYWCFVLSIKPLMPVGFRLQRKHDRFYTELLRTDNISSNFHRLLEQVRRIPILVYNRPSPEPSSPRPHRLRVFICILYIVISYIYSSISWKSYLFSRWRLDKGEWLLTAGGLVPDISRKSFISASDEAISSDWPIQEVICKYIRWTCVITEELSTFLWSGSNERVHITFIENETFIARNFAWWLQIRV